MFPLHNAVRTFKLPAVSGEMTAAEAITQMVANDFMPLLVLRKDRTDAYGILTKRDIIKKVLAEGKDLKKIKVRDIANKSLVMVNDLTMDIRWAARMMAKCGVSTLVVLDKGEFYGFVTDKCIIDEYYNELRRISIDEGKDYVSC